MSPTAEGAWQALCARRGATGGLCDRACNACRHDAAEVLLAVAVRAEGRGWDATAEWLSSVAGEMGASG